MRMRVCENKRGGARIRDKRNHRRNTVGVVVVGGSPAPAHIQVELAVLQNVAQGQLLALPQGGVLRLLRQGRLLQFSDKAKRQVPLGKSAASKAAPAGGSRAGRPSGGVRGWWLLTISVMFAMRLTEVATVSHCSERTGNEFWRAMGSGGAAAWAHSQRRTIGAAGTGGRGREKETHQSPDVLAQVGGQLGGQRLEAVNLAFRLWQRRGRQ
jgi:hypothetical protein